MFRNSSLLLMSALLFSCGPATTTAPSEKINSQYRTSGFTWSTREAGIDFFFRVKKINGFVGVCGAYADRTAAKNDLTERVAGSAVVYSDDVALTSNVLFFRFHGQADSLFGKEANCVSTDIAWSPEFGQRPPRLQHNRLSFK